MSIRTGSGRSAPRAAVGLLVAFALVLMVPLPAAASAPGAGNGTFAVQVMSDGQWKTVAEAAFGTQYATNTLALPGSFDRVRLVESGGTAAQLDAAIAGGAPIAVAGSADPLALAKLAAVDNDVTNVFEGAVVVSFAEPASSLALTARIQGDLAGAFPFQYPVDNLFRPVTGGSAFYSVDVAGLAAAVDTKATPFMAELAEPDTGHPDGYTYAWLADDGENLLVTIDFTSDNTMDADEDYASVHVKTAAGVKSFTITASDATWGDVAFTYTDKVAYQHKVYSFSIPWSAVGGRGAKVETALTAYGTSAVYYFPVYRFWRAASGTHFYTASPEEKAIIEATWPTIYTYEGIAFTAARPGGAPPEIDVYRVPLYRFYNVRNGSHFYTMSAEEKAYVEAHYAATYRYEGVAFEVYGPEVMGDGPFSPVHRFYNTRNGSHFYTASADEADLVRLLWPDVYRYEGPAFYVLYGPR